MDPRRVQFCNNNANVRIADETPCEDNLLLHFPFENSFDDVTCHGAVATKYGSGSVELITDPVHGNVASFDGSAYLEVLHDKQLIRCTFTNTHVRTYARTHLLKQSGRI